MFIDYVTLLLINMSAGLFLLAFFFIEGVQEADARRWSPAFAIVGLVGTSCGLHMTWTWPLPGPFNSAFGEMSVLLGALFLGAALATAMRVSLLPLGVYALLAGLAAVALGCRIIHLQYFAEPAVKLTKEPLLSGLGFILTGGAGVLVLPALALKARRGPRILMALVLAAAGLLWAAVAFPAYWEHLEGFGKYLPPTLKGP